MANRRAVAVAERGAPEASRGTRGGKVAAVAAAALEDAGFASRAELTEWLTFVSWLDDPDADQSRYVLVDDGTGWIPAQAIELRARRSTPPPLAPCAAPRLLTLAEAGVRLRAAPETVRYWIWQGRLQGYKPGRAVLVREDELLALCNSPKTRNNRRAPTRRGVRVVARK
jgi:excisionase family DNA binding protein